MMASPKTSGSIVSSPSVSMLNPKQTASLTDSTGFPWPEWNDADIAAEKWTTWSASPINISASINNNTFNVGGNVSPSSNALTTPIISGPQGTVKFTGSTNIWGLDDFESTHAYLPHSLRSHFDSIKRASEVSPPSYWGMRKTNDLSILSINSFPQSPYPPWSQTTSNPNLPTSRISTPHTPNVKNAHNFTSYEDMFVPKLKIEGSPWLDSQETHLMTPMLQVNAPLNQISSTIHNLIVKLHALVILYNRSPFFNHTQSIASKPGSAQNSHTSPLVSSTSGMPVEMDYMLPWDHIYPKNKEGTPQYNPEGKYAVKLWCFGAWRKVLVDDKIPLDKKGDPLLPTSPTPGEIWPWILSKALLKMSAISDDISNHGTDSDCACFIKMLTGCESQDLFTEDYFGFQFSSKVSTPFNSYVTSTIQKRFVDESASVSSTLSQNQNSSPASRNTTTGSGGPYSSQALVPSSPRSKSATSSNLPSHIPGIVLAVLDEIKGLSHVTVLAQILNVMEPNNSNSQSYKMRLFPCHLPIQATSTWESEISMSADDLIASCTSILILHFPSNYRLVNHIAHAIQISPAVSNSTSSAGISSPSTSTITSPPTINSSALTTTAIMSNQELWPRSPPILYNPNEHPVEVLIGFQSHKQIDNKSYQNKPSLVIEELGWPHGWGETSPYYLSSRFQNLRAYGLLVQLGAFGSRTVTIPARESVKLVANAPLCYTISVYARNENDIVIEDEKQHLSDHCGVSVCDFEESYAAVSLPNEWGILMKYTFQLKSSLRVGVQLQVPEVIAEATILRLIDNDSMEFRIGALLDLRPKVLRPNVKGYTILAECRTPFSRPTGKFRLRLLSSPSPLIINQESPIDLGVKPWSSIYQDVYAPNKRFQLFRTIIRIPNVAESHVSMHLSINMPNVYLVLELLENDKTLFKYRAKEYVVVPNVILYITDNVVVVPMAVEKDKAEIKEKPAKEKGADKDKNIAIKDTEVKDRSRLSPPSSALARSRPIRRYILQAFLEPNEALVQLFSESSQPAIVSSVGANRRESSASKLSASVVKGGIKKQINEKDRAGTLGSETTNDKKLSSSVSGGALKDPNAKLSSPILSIETGNGPNATTTIKWTLRVTSSDSQGLHVVKDADRDEHYRSIKDGWEQKQSGRAMKGREVREQFLSSLRAEPQSNPSSNYLPISDSSRGMSTPVVKYKPPSLMNRNLESSSSFSCSDGFNSKSVAESVNRTKLYWLKGLSTLQGIPFGLPQPENFAPSLISAISNPAPQSRTQPDQIREREISEWNEITAQIRAWHANGNKLAERTNKQLVEVLDQMHAKVKSWQDIDHSARLSYRQSIFHDREQEAANRALTVKIEAERLIEDVVPAINPPVIQAEVKDKKAKRGK